MASYSRGVVTQKQWDVIADYILQSKIVHAIKEWRSITGDGLCESKYVMDEFRDNGIIPELKSALYGVKLPKILQPLELMDIVCTRTQETCISCDEDGAKHISSKIGSCDGVMCSDCIFKTESDHHNREEQKKMLHDLILTGDIIV